MTERRMSHSRAFRLPGVEDLTKEQEQVLALPREGQHLIVGGPGTGKTVVCLLRARRLSRLRVDYRFLVFNHLLRQMSAALFEGDLRSETWMGWFFKVFRACVGEEIPRGEPEASGFRPIDWPGARASLAASLYADPPFLVIDEGQDMPPDFYFLLKQFGFENFFVAMDQNQQIKDENSSRDELRKEMALSYHEVHVLKRNHRNSYPIARLARAFYTGDPASPPPELPPPSVEAVPPVLFQYRDLNTVADGILTHWDRDPRRLIGVIAPNDDVRGRYLHELRAAASRARLDNGPPSIGTFHGDHRPQIRFDRGGILVINAQACKGQEFDSVFLADIDEHVRFADPDHTKKRFYVMTSRAKSHLTLLMQWPSKSWIEEILPEDRAILRREDL